MRSARHWIALVAMSLAGATGPAHGQTAPETAAKRPTDRVPQQPPAPVPARRPTGTSAASTATVPPLPEKKPIDASAAKTEAPAKAGKAKLVPAKELFGAALEPAPLAARSIGFYAKGCLAGAKPLPVDGAAWQAMRLSRNRNWGHPDLIALIERFAAEVKKDDGWNGLLVGDISQPRGGPMLTGHASHQIGLDADFWLTPMPNRTLTRQEREDLSATSMLGADKISVDPKIWTEAHARVIKRAASYRKVERILVHPAIKKALCDFAGNDRGWLHKVRPWWGHHYHFHMRIGCPRGSIGCKSQPPPPGDDGCGKEIETWFKKLTAPKPPPPVKPTPPKPPMTLDQLPIDCRIVLDSGNRAAPRPAVAPATASTVPK